MSANKGSSTESAGWKALLRYDRPSDESIAPAARRTDRERPPAVSRRTGLAWPLAATNCVRSSLGLVDQAARFDVEQREWADELDIDGRDDDITLPRW
ncbi:hypothetical protein [Mycobacterium riyadhense]|uniref:hypothetical protein n=1 Tax=Mycobacterium riyadhense TaxID=486698 RepID=UPI0019503DDC|nr:hypothetical protein [Mycobacterium riyadhense]